MKNLKTMADFEDQIPSEAEEELEAVVETEQGIAITKILKNFPMFSPKIWTFKYYHLK